MDQSDAELGAHQGQLLGAEICSVVDKQTERQAAADQGLLEHRQEGDGVLAAGKGSVGDDAGGVVDEGDQVGLVTLAASADLGAVHDIAHPQLNGELEGKAAAVDAKRLVSAFAHEALAAEQTVHGGRRQTQVVGELAGADGAGDHLAHRPDWVFGLGGDQQLDHVGRQAARPAAVGGRLGVERVEAAAAVELESVADGLGGDAGALRAGDGVLLLGLGAQQGADAGGAGREQQQIGDDAVTEQCDLAPQVVIRNVHERPPRDCGSGDSLLEGSYRGSGGGPVPWRCWRAIL